ncbi:recombinase family protein [Streptomyces griseofuscus]|uniref:recombinase family protein n=1 Tax=Streptomyces griseofuscus TaxID=146922 RepID=UPI0036D2006D
MPIIRSITDRVLRLILYIRVSTAREDMISPELQEHTGRKHAASIGAVIVDVVKDLDVSGGDFAKRKIGHIIHRIANDEADGVLVYRWDRFGRNIELSLTNLRMLEGMGGIAQSATEHFDTTTAAGRFARTNMLGVAELQREQIGENWQSTHAQRLRRGLPFHGSPRFGYWYCDVCPMPEPRSPRGIRRERRRRQVCEKCKEGIQIPRPIYGEALGYSFREYSDGKPMAKVAHEIRLEGLTTYAGHAITDARLMNIMDTGFGAGYLRVRPTSRSWAEELPPSEVESIGNRKLDDFVYVPGAQPSVIENEDVWGAYLERRRAKDRRAGNKSKAKYPNSGLVYCIDCGDKKGRLMRAGSSRGAAGGKYLTWRCSGIDEGTCNHSNANRAATDEVVFDWLKKWAKDDGTARIAAQEVIEAHRGRPTPTAEWESEISHLKRLKKNLIRMRAAEEIDQADFIEQRDEINDDLKALESKLKKTKNQKSVVIPDRDVFQGLVEEWPHLDDDTKRMALRKVIWRITVKRGDWDDTSRYAVIPLWEQPEPEKEP